MDPLSVLASVLAVAGATAQTAKSLYELVDGVRHAPDEIVALSKDTHAFYNIVFSLETSLRDRKISKMVGEEQPLTILVGNLEEPLKNCSAALGRLMVKIQSVVRPLDGERFRMSSNELKWYFMKKEIKELTDQVERTKATLNNAQTNVITYCILHARANSGGELRRLIRTRTDDTDAGCALRSFAEEREMSILTGASSLNENPVDPAVSSSEPAEEDFEQRLTLHSNSTTLVDPQNDEKSKSEPVIDNVERLRRAENQRNGLINAAKEGDDLVLELMIQEGAYINAKDKDGKAALHYAAESGNVDIAQVLVDNRANVNLKSTAKGSPVERKFKGGRSPLHFAASNGNQDMVELLLQKGADVNAQNASGRTALQDSIMRSQDSVAIYLLNKNASVTLIDSEGWTALHQAANEGRTKVIEALINRGADIEAKTAEDTIWGSMNRFRCATPLFLANGSGQRASVELLMKRGANIKTRNIIGEMPIHTACWRGFKPLVRIYLDAGIRIEERDTIYEETPLLKAASTGQTDIVKFLLEKGADIQAENPHGRDALMHARLHRPNGENDETVKVLEAWYREHHPKWQKVSDDTATRAV